LATDTEPTGTNTRIPEDLGRFDRSFVVHMIGSFVVFLLAVAVLEIGIRFAIVWYEFERHGHETAQEAAEELSDDIRDIMINQGGPVASRTVYPILARAFDRSGLEIAILPSEPTTESIERIFAFTPRGIPPDFSEGAHHEARVEVRAEELCLRCHVSASVGDALGTVVVRDYRSARLEMWWEEVQLTLTLNLLKIVVHTVILFFLLRLLMGPLLSLRNAVGRLALGRGGLAVRAEVRSSDEFGELAADLNAFLDRISSIVEDLRTSLGRTMAVNYRLASVTGQVEAQVNQVDEALRATVAAAQDAAGVAPAMERLPRLIREVHDLKHLIREIGFLEDHLRDVSEAERDLLARLAEEQSDG